MVPRIDRLGDPHARAVRPATDRPGHVWGGDERHERGALVLAPLYSDMSTDIRDDPTDPNQALRLWSLVGDILADAVRFAHNRLGADYLGSGATLPHPSLTDFGRKIRAISGWRTSRPRPGMAAPST